MGVLVSEHISYPPVNAQLRDCNSSVWHGTKEEEGKRGREKEELEVKRREKG